MGWEDLPDRVPDDEADGACIDDPAWLLDGDILLKDFLSAVRGLLPSDAVLYLEGRDPEGQVARLLESEAAPERLHLAFGTIWPRPRVWHLPVTEVLLDELARLADQSDDLRFVRHLHVYDGEGVLVWWHDAGANKIVVSRRFGEEQIRVLESRLGTPAVQHAHPADCGACEVDSG